MILRHGSWYSFVKYLQVKVWNVWYKFSPLHINRFNVKKPIMCHCYDVDYAYIKIYVNIRIIILWLKKIQRMGTGGWVINKMPHGLRKSERKSDFLRGSAVISILGQSSDPKLSIFKGLHERNFQFSKSKNTGTSELKSRRPQMKIHPAVLVLQK